LIHEEDQHEATEDHKLYIYKEYIKKVIFLVDNYEFYDSKGYTEIEKPF
jgi:hypothetical protein